MTTQSFVTYANAPANNVESFGVFMCFLVYGTVTSWTSKVEAFSGSNGSGSRVTCGSLTAFNHDYFTGTDLNSFTAASANTAQASSGNGILNHILGTAGKWATSGSPGSLVLTTIYDDSFGILIPLIRRSGAWSPMWVNVRRSGIWSANTGTRVRRSGIWVG